MVTGSIILGNRASIAQVRTLPGVTALKVVPLQVPALVYESMVRLPFTLFASNCRQRFRNGYD
jgi:hypothetical protein